MAKIQLTSETHSLDRRKPGFALLKISGWTHSPEQTQMSIQSSEDEKFLGMDGQWEPTPVWQSLSSMNQVEANVLEGDVGPALVDPIVNSPNNSYRVTLKSDSDSEVKTMRVDSNILASSASGSAPDSLAFGNGFILDDFDAGANVTEEPEELEISDSEIDVEPETVVTDTSKKSVFFARNKMILIIALVLFLLAILAAAWHFEWLSVPSFIEEVLQEKETQEKETQEKETQEKETQEKETQEKETQEKETQEKETQEKETQEKETQEKEIQEKETQEKETQNPVYSNLTDMELLRQFLATKPSTDDILTKAEEWKNGHCKAMLKMMVYSGHKNNDSRIAFEYAKMHDPNLFTAGGCIAKGDKDTAVYWYQKSIDAGNTDAKSYLEKL